jgi:hypothetical protein
MEITNLSYAEVKGEKPFNWLEYLSRPIEQYEGEDVEGAERRSASWVTCAVGNLCAAIPRREFTQEPMDWALCTLGLKFHNILSEWRDYYMEVNPTAYPHQERLRGEALDCLRQIEQRSIEVLTELKEGTYPQEEP